MGFRKKHSKLSSRIPEDLEVCARRALVEITREQLEILFEKFCGCFIKTLMKN